MALNYYIVDLELHICILQKTTNLHNSVHRSEHIYGIMNGWLVSDRWRKNGQVMASHEEIMENLGAILCVISFWPQSI